MHKSCLKNSEQGNNVINGVNKQANGVGAEMLRLNTAIPAVPCAMQNRLGIVSEILRVGGVANLAALGLALLLAACGDSPQEVAAPAPQPQAHTADLPASETADPIPVL